MAQNIFRKFVSEAQAVLKYAEKQTNRVLGQFGGYARKTAKNSIKKSAGPAETNHPPHAHGDQLLKKFIFYALVKPASVIVGPARLNGMIGDAPQALEKGGRSKVRRGTRRHPRIETIVVSKHPYMGPAGEKAEKALPKMWADSVKP